MARIRTIKPEFPQSESMGQISRDARLLFIQLWTLCDDHGKARAASRMLASLLYPYDDDAPGLIEGWLQELERQNCITRYEVDGARYLKVLNWGQHQRIDRPSPSKFPDPREPSREIADTREPSMLDQGSRIKEGKGGDARAHALPESWQPDDEDIAWAAKARPDLDRAALDAETERFRLHASAHSRTAHRWGDGWRLWVSKARVAEPSRPAPGGKHETPTLAHDDDGQWRARLKSYRPGKFWLEGDWGPRPESGQSRVPPVILGEWQQGIAT